MTAIIAAISIGANVIIAVTLYMALQHRDQWRDKAMALERRLNAYRAICCDDRDYSDAAKRGWQTRRRSEYQAKAARIDAAIKRLRESGVEVQ